MGNPATPESLLHRWEELQRDPSLQDLHAQSAFHIAVTLPDLTKGYP